MCTCGMLPSDIVTRTTYHRDRNAVLRYSVHVPYIKIIHHHSRFSLHAHSLVNFVHYFLCFCYRFPAMDGGENEMKMGGKGVKGKRRQKNSSVSSSAGNASKEGNLIDIFGTNHKVFL